MRGGQWMRVSSKARWPAWSRAPPGFDAYPAIEQHAVSKIVSGQIITDLESAVKELVENSLDAKATSIEIRFKEYGLDSFEVQDNGAGIAQADHSNIALRAHTSKLRSFDGLADVTTFGFRGEALASLCSLARVSVSTATQDDAPLGHLLGFDKRGALVSSAREARTRGTTVTVSKLFEGVPVRRKDLERTIKKHFAKMQILVQAYAIISLGTHISLVNTDKGKRTPLLISDGSSMSGTLARLFGSKAFQTLTPLDLDFSVQPEKVALKYTENGSHETRVQVEGFISKPQYGQGRSSTDRQFFFINGRPFTPSKIPRAFNEVYRIFNSNQSPCVVANFRVSTDAYDVNLSPDKRTILIHSEANLIEALKTNLEVAWTPFRSTFDLPHPAATRQIGVLQPKRPSVRPLESDWELDEQATRGPSPASDEIDEDTTPLTQSTIEVATTPPVAGQTLSVAVSIEPRQLMLDTSGTTWALREDARHGEHPSKRRKVDRDSAPSRRTAFPGVARSFAPNDGSQRILELRRDEVDPADSQWDDLETRSSLSLHATEVPDSGSGAPRSLFRSQSVDENADSTPSDFSDAHQTHSDEDEANDEVLDQGASRHLQLLASEGSGEHVHDTAASKQLYESSHALDFDMASVRKAWSKPVKSGSTHLPAITEHENPHEAHSAGLATDDAEAEATLSRIVSQDDFASMAVVGQFNLGFIIARGRKDGHDDLWILDQHASDEKRNFEECVFVHCQHAVPFGAYTVQTTTRLQSQRQLLPLEMNLPAADELLVFDNLDILKANGFEVAVNEHAVSGSRIQLIAHPTSKSTIFGVSDLEELIHLLHDAAPGQLVRPSKVRAMFAMRACRMSVMVGTPLTVPQMTGIIRRMQTMKEPWSCPHGRPTMRWLAAVGSDEGFVDDHRVDWIKDRCGS